MKFAGIVKPFNENGERNLPKGIAGVLVHLEAGTVCRFVGVPSGVAVLLFDSKTDGRELGPAGMAIESLERARALVAELEEAVKSFTGGDDGTVH